MKSLSRLRTLGTLTIAAAIVAAMAFSGSSQPQKVARKPISAWDQLVLRDPTVVLDDLISPLERLVLSQLTPEQAEDLFNGADPAEILLPSGQSLEEMMSARLSSAGGGLVYQPLIPCTILDTRRGSAGSLEPNEIRPFRFAGAQSDLSLQGGSFVGCGIPRDSEAPVKALIVDVRPVDPVSAGDIRLWTADQAEPGAVQISFRENEPRFASLKILHVCQGSAE